MKRSRASTSTRRLSSARCSSWVSGLRNSPRSIFSRSHVALAVAAEVLDLVGDRAAVGLAQVRQRVGERRARDAHAQDARRDPGHELGRQPDGLGLERRVALGLGAERVQPRGQVAVGAVGLQERRGGLDGLQQLLGGRAVDVAPAGRRACGVRAAAAAAAGRRRLRRGAELGAERREDALVEAVLALEVALDDLQEAAGLRPLDDAVVVGRGHRHDLLGADHGADGPEADRVGDRAGRDDRARAGHEPRDRRDGADAARVGQLDVRADEVVGAELVLARPRDEVVEGRLEVAEAQAPGVADDRDHQGPRAVLLLDVDRDAEVARRRRRRGAACRRPRRSGGP